VYVSHGVITLMHPLLQRKTADDLAPRTWARYLHRRIATDGSDG
jgi:hypothetical protein